MSDTDPRDLHARQILHPILTAKLIQYVAELGYGVAWGETWRPPAMAKLNAASGAGIANSLHCQRLAADLLLFKGGEYLNDDDTGAYTTAGTYWKTLDPLCAWGGDFTTKDYDHFSITFHGVK